jgi:DNA-binding MarR family transcriptional regulator
MHEKELRLETYVEEMSLKHLTYNHLCYLTAVQHLKSPTLSQLSDFLEVSKPSVTNMVNKLIAERLLIKTKNPEDQRSYIVTLSDFGKEFMSYEKKTFINICMNFMKNLSLEEFKTLANL